MVLGPMKIFSLRVMARRTSFSLTNTEIWTAGFAGASVFVGFGDGAGALATAAAFAGIVGPKKRAAISAATSLGLGNGFAAWAGRCDGE
jgi:hypothetical protein